MIEVIGSIHNGRLREKSYARAVVSYGEGNVGVDIWRRFAPLDQELTLVERRTHTCASVSFCVISTEL